MPSFKFEDNVFQLISPEQSLTKLNKDVHYLDDEKFANTVEGFSYTCVDAIPLVEINGKLCLGVAQRANSDKVVYLQPWIFGGRSVGFDTPQKALAGHVKRDIFGGSLDGQELEAILGKLRYFSSNIAFYSDPEREGRSKSTTNLTHILDPRKVYSNLWLKHLNSKLNDKEYEGDIMWIPIDQINNLKDSKNKKVELKTLNSRGENNINDLVLEIILDKPGSALWNKLVEAVNNIS